MEDKRKRSRSYPGYALGDCIEWVTQIKPTIGSGPYDRETISKALGSNKITGATTRKIAAMAYFGLLSRETNGYYLTPLSEQITRALDEEERANAIIEAFYQPELYKEVMEKCEVDGRIPTQLTHLLIRHHGIEDSVAEDAARIFLSSGKFAGVISDNKIIKTRITSNDTPSANTPDQSSRNENSLINIEASTVNQEMMTLSSMKKYNYPLTKNRYAELIVPNDLTSTDIKLLKKQIEILEMACEIEENI